MIQKINIKNKFEMLTFNLSAFFFYVLVFDDIFGNHMSLCCDYSIVLPTAREINCYLRQLTKVSPTFYKGTVFVLRQSDKGMLIVLLVQNHLSSLCSLYQSWHDIIKNTTNLYIFIYIPMNIYIYCKTSE